MSDLRARMHVGVVHPMAFPDAAKSEEALIETVGKIAADHYFGAIELRPLPSPGARDQVLRLVRAAGLVPVIAAQPALLGGKLNLNAEDAAARKAAVDCAKAAVDDALAVGAPHVAVLSGPDPGPAARERATGLLAESLGDLCAYASGASTGKTAIHIALETFDRAVDKKCLVGPTELAVEVMERVKAMGHENVGLMIDLSHLPLLQEAPKACLTAAKPHLIHTHVGNAFIRAADDPAYGDQHPRFGYPGSMVGVADVAEFLAVLIGIGYFETAPATGKPVVTFEVKPLPGECPEAVLAGTKRVFDAALALAG